MARIFTEKRKDRAADVIIRGGGILVILVVIAIVVNIGLEALPLFYGAKSGAIETVEAGESVLAVGSDPRREAVWSLSRDGHITVRREGTVTTIEVFEAPVSVVAADHEIHGLVSAISSDGEVAVGQVRFRDVWTGGIRATGASWRAAADPLRVAAFDHNDEARHATAWSAVTANGDSEGNLVVAAWDEDGSLALAGWDAEDEQWSELPAPSGLAVARVAIAEELEHLATVDLAGKLSVYQLPSMRPLPVEGVHSPVAAVRFLIGGGSLVVAEVSGAVGMVLIVPKVKVSNRGTTTTTVVGNRLAPGEVTVIPDDEIGRRLASREDIVVSAAVPEGRRVRDLPALSSEPTVIAPSHRRRGFLVGARDGAVALYHSTSGRRLLAQRWSYQAVSAAAIDPKGDGAIVASGSDLLRRSIHNPHPEISFRTLFLPVWYEGYAAPRWVWQSTGGSDAFEPKMSLWPLIFGTLKATLYALVFSLPLALLAAVYISQLAPSWLQSVVKPTVELMAAVPSVVVGFLAALWLAPRLEQALLPTLLSLGSLPLAVLVALGLWRLTPGRLRRRVPAGAELVVLFTCCAVIATLAWKVAAPIETALFDGDLQRFLFTEWGLRYDQRNSIVVGLALGFAVIPVIFTIAEDACSAVPKNLVTASRALGATRWQTAVRLVVPAASPGLFAAVMLGLGRAVGETMIVLMAAGNTPLLDLSAFNGMRTMSAAIAVEIPEAPVGGTLFRVLFLTGTLLFFFTLLLTTAADLVGSYLRKRYARF